MKTHYQPLNPKHADKFTWIPPADLEYIAGQPIVPIHAGELAMAASTMPLALAQIEGEWNLVAVAGLQPQHNLFVKNGKWLGRYQPASVATYDFDMQTVAGMMLLRFNTAGKLSANPGAAGAESMYDAQGQLTPRVAAIQDTLKKITPLLAVTRQAVQALADAGVLQPWTEQLKQGLGMKLDGLYLVDEAALARLSPESFLKLREARALGIAYAVNLSIFQGHLLKRLDKHNPAVDSPADVDTLFGENLDDDTLKFDF